MLHQGIAGSLKLSPTIINNKPLWQFIDKSFSNKSLLKATWLTRKHRPVAMYDLQIKSFFTGRCNSWKGWNVSDLATFPDHILIKWASVCDCNSQTPFDFLQLLKPYVLNRHELLMVTGFQDCHKVQHYRIQNNNIVKTYLPVHTRVTGWRLTCDQVAPLETLWNNPPKFTQLQFSI